MKPADHTPGEWLPLKKVFADVTKLAGDDADLALSDIQRVLDSGQGLAMRRSLARGDGHEVPVTFWQTHRLSSVAPGHIIVRSKEYPPKDYRYFLRRADVEKIWPINTQPTTAADETRPPWPRKSRAGAPSKYDWEDIIVKTADHMLKNGVPEKLTELCNQVEKRFADKPPGETELKKHLRPLHRIFLDSQGK
jgi:hypothetical protein